MAMAKDNYIRLTQWVWPAQHDLFCRTGCNAWARPGFATVAHHLQGQAQSSRLLTEARRQTGLRTSG